MKTARFSDLVQRCGAPEPHLIFSKPAKDKVLQAAIKARRVLTVFQEAVGSRQDYGEVGFSEGGSRQYLLFPKSLRSFEGHKIVGIKYDLLSSKEVPKGQRAKRAGRPRKPARQKAAARAVAAEPSTSTSKVVAFRLPEQDDSDGDEDDDALAEIKSLARQAMRALDQGKQTAAYNLLKRIAGH